MTWKFWKWKWFQRSVPQAVYPTFVVEYHFDKQIYVRPILPQSIDDKSLAHAFGSMIASLSSGYMLQLLQTSVAHAASEQNRQQAAVNAIHFSQELMDQYQVKKGSRPIVHPMDVFSRGDH
jgi:hypothetical protein